MGEVLPPHDEGLPRRRKTKVASVNMGTYTLSKRGVARHDWADPYRLAVALTWPQFVLALLGFYLAVNLVFATLYWIVPGSVANAKPGSLLDTYFFSVETLATVGYGEMYPGTRYGHSVAAVEIVCGVAITAIITGLIFVRFSRPRAKFLFAEHPVMTTHNGRSTLMLRVGNGRASTLSDAHAKISVLLAEQSIEGTRFRRTHQLSLIRSEIPVFPLSWTLMHEVVDSSPLHGLTAETFDAADTRLFVSLEARDPALATLVHDLRQYGPGDVKFGMKYVDMIEDDENGRPVADMDRVSDIEPDVSN